MIVIQRTVSDKAAVKWNTFTENFTILVPTSLKNIFTSHEAF